MISVLLVSQLHLLGITVTLRLCLVGNALLIPPFSFCVSAYVCKNMQTYTHACTHTHKKELINIVSLYLSLSLMQKLNFYYAIHAEA